MRADVQQPVVFVLFRGSVLVLLLWSSLLSNKPQLRGARQHVLRLGFWRARRLTRPPWTRGAGRRNGCVLSRVSGFMLRATNYGVFRDVDTRTRLIKSWWCMYGRVLRS